MSESTLHAAIGRISAELQTALDRFAERSRIADLARVEVPHARTRLEHVLDLTSDAAHRTLELVEQSIPLLDGAAAQAADPRVREQVERVRGNLTEVLLAQGFQDLSGQIIRNVIVLVGEIETVLGELLQLSTSPGGTAQASAAGTKPPPAANVHGPVVPGIPHGNAVDGQQDVDSLLSGLGL